jgi:hypothetical protein
LAGGLNEREPVSEYSESVHHLLEFVHLTQSTILIKRRDVLFRRHELRISLDGRSFDEVEDRLLGRSIIP